jgi:hypothetical protein
MPFLFYFITIPKIVIMKREEFLMEAALRLIAAKPEENMWEIASMANDLTDRIFESVQQQEADSERWWSEEADKAPVNVIIGQIEKSSWRSTGYGVRLTRIFKDGNINTVGDLLRVGRHEFKRYRDVGGGSITRIDDALEELYNIQSW